MKRVLFILLILMISATVFAQETVSELVDRYIERIEFATAALEKQTEDIKLILDGMTALEETGLLSEESFDLILAEFTEENYVTMELLEASDEEIKRIDYMTLQFLPDLYSRLEESLTKFNEAYNNLNGTSLDVLLKIIEVRGILSDDDEWVNDVI